MSEGLRYDDDKIKYHLLEPFAIEQVARIFTKGAKKYEENNWLKGMKWSKMLASARRHEAAYLRGEDYDFYPDTCEACKNGTCTNHTGELHAAQAAWNWLAITSYYKHFPQGDDRYKRPEPRIGLDIDDVICVWVDEWCKKFNKPIPTNWNFQWNLMEEFERMKGTELDEFYLNLPVKIKSEDIPFDPVCYITHRPVNVSITSTWLEKHGFPLKPIYQVEKRIDKLEVAKTEKLDYFVDDNWETYCMMNQNGICCFLMDTPHNKKHNAGYRRIYDLKGLI